MNNEAHLRLTGASNGLILENLLKLKRFGSEIIVRIPLIPSYNDSPLSIRQFVDFVVAAAIKRVEILPLNIAAGSKYTHIGKVYPLASSKPPDIETLRQIRGEFERKGVITNVRM